MRVASVSLWQRSGPFISDIISTQSVCCSHVYARRRHVVRGQRLFCNSQGQFIMASSSLRPLEQDPHACATILQAHVLTERKMYALASAPTSTTSIISAHAPR
ncbi:hypothetical protein FRC03_004773 [Tulasnella sp. 419]|nr:hypothetical protein FRC03_004773 [Tulasnella sp. 419]